jgi:hypothetical protein
VYSRIKGVKMKGFEGSIWGERPKPKRFFKKCKHAERECPDCENDCKNCNEDGFKSRKEYRDFVEGR